MQGYAEIKSLILGLLKQRETIIVVVSGPQGTGKSTLISRVAKDLDGAIISTDSYFKPPEVAEQFSLYFDDPRAVKIDELIEHIKGWRNGKGIRMPMHDIITHKDAGTREIPHKKVLFVEGVMSFHPKIRNLSNLKIYVDASTGKRIKRRLKRDVKIRGRKPSHVMGRFYSTLEESRLRLLEGWKTNADLIVIA